MGTAKHKIRTDSFYSSDETRLLTRVALARHSGIQQQKTHAIYGLGLPANFRAALSLVLINIFVAIEEAEAEGAIQGRNVERAAGKVEEHGVEGIGHVFDGGLAVLIRKIGIDRHLQQHTDEIGNTEFKTSPHDNTVVEALYEGVNRVIGSQVVVEDFVVPQIGIDGVVAPQTHKIVDAIVAVAQGAALFSPDGQGEVAKFVAIVATWQVTQIARVVANGSGKGTYGPAPNVIAPLGKDGKSLVLRCRLEKDNPEEG